MESGLTIEQQFKLKVLKEEAQSLTREKAIEYLLELIRQDMAKTNLMTKLMKSNL